MDVVFKEYKKAESMMSTHVFGCIDIRFISQEPWLLYR